jgi:succinyl-diaminopimelate desuccinylase
MADTTATTAREQIEGWVDAHRDTVIAETQAILRIPSVEEKGSVGPGAPFGRPVADALEHTLALCARLGMQTQNFDGYAGHAEFGAGDEAVAMLGHLDVVPAGKGWTKEPFGGEVSDGWLWSRGASDDKGPTYAALFGAAAVAELIREGKLPAPKRRIRLIFGCDEESGWQCMAHYFGAAGQPKPTYAFTPDADFPLVYAEKGSFTGIVARSAPADEQAAVRVAAFDSGLRPNMVPDEAVATLTGDPTPLDAAARALADLPGIDVQLDADSLVVLAKGKGAHGATPEQGDNAAVKLARALTESGAVPGFAVTDADWLADVARRGAPDGSTVGIGGSDDVTGPLTCNLGVVTLENGEVRATFNVRYPATWDGEETLAKFAASVGETGWRVAEQHHTPPLYVPQDAEPVRTLLRVYREHTGDQSAPHTMGGRTYATTVAPVGVAFGAAMPGDPEVAHQADERFAVERLIQCAKIYGHALYELANAE